MTGNENSEGAIQKYQPQHTIPTTHELNSLRGMAELVAKSSFYKDLNGLEKAATVMLQGFELGISPMAAIRNIHIINGKPNLSPPLMIGIA
ncbi:MAG: hypothetical protein WCS37_20240, partial [Chloroflexota bacterium]